MASGQMRSEAAKMHTISTCKLKTKKEKQLFPSYSPKGLAIDIISKKEQQIKITISTLVYRSFLFTVNFELS